MITPSCSAAPKTIALWIEPGSTTTLVAASSRSTGLASNGFGRVVGRVAGLRQHLAGAARRARPRRRRWPSPVGICVAEDRAAPRTAGRGRWSAAASVPGWAGVSLVVAARDLLGQVALPLGLPISKIRSPSMPRSSVVVARLQALQAGEVLAGEADQVGRQVVRRARRGARRGRTPMPGRFIAAIRSAGRDVHAAGQVLEPRLAAARPLRAWPSAGSSSDGGDAEQRRQRSRPRPAGSFDQLRVGERRSAPRRCARAPRRSGPGCCRAARAGRPR